jgi:hypothetical protein
MAPAMGRSWHGEKGKEKGRGKEGLLHRYLFAGTNSLRCVCVLHFILLLAVSRSAFDEHNTSTILPPSSSAAATATPGPASAPTASTATPAPTPSYDTRSSLLAAELQRKEDTIQQLKARVAELSRSHSEQVNSRAQMDIFETQVRMREEEWQQKISACPFVCVCVCVCVVERCFVRGSEFGGGGVWCGVVWR